MNKIIDIVCPTLNRSEKLHNCIRSILDSNLPKDYLKNYIRIYIYVNTVQEQATYIQEFNCFPFIRVDLVKDYCVPSFWNTHLNKMSANLMITCNDDITFEKDTLNNILNYYYCSDDHILGLNQCNIEGALDSAFTVIPKNYACNFDNCAVFCPDYKRFYADKELGEYAKSINQFIFAEDCKINHFHGSFYGKDSTHLLVRKYLNNDKQTYLKRQKRGLLWGKDKTLIN